MEPTLGTEDSTAPVTSQQSEFVLRDLFEGVKTILDVGNTFIASQASDPSASADNGEVCKDSSSTIRVGLRRATKIQPREKVSFLEEVAKGSTSPVHLCSQTVVGPSSVSYINPSGKTMFSCSPKSSTTDGVYPDQLFNSQPDSNMGFMLVDPTPKVICSVRSKNPPPHMSLGPESSANVEFEESGHCANGDSSLPCLDIVLVMPSLSQLGVGQSQATVVITKENSAGTSRGSPAKNLRSNKQKSVSADVKVIDAPAKNLRNKKQITTTDVKDIDSPAKNLRSKKQSTTADGEDGSLHILRSLEKIVNSTIVSKFLEKLANFRGRKYNLDDNSFRRSIFIELSKPQHWVSSLHIDMIITLVWKKHGAFLATRRITVVNSMFTTIIENKNMRFKQSLQTDELVWHPLLIAYVRGVGASRSTNIHCLRDADFVYMPMNWGKKHWVALAIDLCKGHINILDPFEDCTSSRKVVAFMCPFAQMLPNLLRSVCEDIPSMWPATAFTFDRVSDLAQNIRGGDCGALCVKFMELHSHGLIQALGLITNEQVDNLRMRYAIDLYEEFVGKI